MSVSVSVSLLSGRTASLEEDLDASVANLKRRAEVALAVGRGRLLNSSGDVLDETTTVKTARLLDGDTRHLQISRLQISSNTQASAAILGDG